MSLFRTLSYSLLLLFLFLGSFPGVASAQADASDRFRQVSALNAIDGDGIRPWHLKVSYQRFNEKGSQTTSGEAEEWWAADDAWRLVVSEGGRTSVRLSTPQGTYHSADTMDAEVRTLLEYMVHPVEGGLSPEIKARAYAHAFGSLKGTCLMLEPAKEFKPPLMERQFQEVPLGLFPTYCVDGANMLIVSHPTASLVLATIKSATFLGHRIPMSAFLAIDQKRILEGQVSDLKTIATADVDLSTTGLTATTSAAANVAAGVMAGAIVEKVQPFYPEGAKHRHATGTVILGAIIGTDGRVHRLRVVSAPDFDLLVAAVDAVSRWRYRPYLLNGDPTDVDTTITVNFNMNY